MDGDCWPDRSIGRIQGRNGGRHRMTDHESRACGWSWRGCAWIGWRPHLSGDACPAGCPSLTDSSARYGDASAWRSKFSCRPGGLAVSTPGAIVVCLLRLSHPCPCPEWRVGRSQGVIWRTDLVQMIGLARERPIHRMGLYDSRCRTNCGSRLEVLLT